MKDFKILKFLDHFCSFFEKLGVDYPVMRKILQMKLIMDGRRTPTVFNGSKKTEEQNNSFVKSLWIYTLMGAITIPFILMGDNYIFQMSIVFGVMIFMVMSSLISDFSSVLLDIRDKNILFTKPVNLKTINIAKIVHIFTYMFYLTIAFVGIPAVVGLVKHGVLFFLIFAAEIILVDLMIVFMTALLYLLILKVFDGEKLKDIINYVQIALALVMSVGYQFIGRLFSFTNLHVTFAPKWWQCFIVPVWFGAPFEVMVKGSANIHYIIFTILAVLVPVLSIFAYVMLMPAFERNLQKLGSVSGNKKQGFQLMKKISRVVCFTKEEKLFFRFASEMMKNEREFKLKVYPSLGLSMVFPFIFLLNQIGFHEQGSPLSGRLCFYIYFCGLLLPTVVQMSRYSSNYKGAWIYKAMPIRDVSPIFKGTVKAFMIRLFIPVFLIDGGIFLYLLGSDIILYLIDIFLNILLFTAICFKIVKPALPFSESYGVTQNEGWVVFALMFALGLLAGVNVLCSFIWFGIYLNMGAALVANFVMWKIVFAVSWERLSV